MRKSNEPLKNEILTTVSEIEYTSHYAFAIREDKCIKAVLVEHADEILPMVTYCERNAESHGGVWGVRMINSRETRETLKAYSHEIITLCSVDYFEELHANGKQRGTIFEELLAEHMGGTLNPIKNCPFTEGGDIIVDGEHIQCKMWNATITTEPTINNLYRKYMEKKA